MIFRSRFPDVEIPEVSLAEFVIGKAAGYGDRPALIDGPSGRTVTYAALANTVSALAAGLTQRGFGKGDVFAVYSPNLPEYAAVLHAVAMLGVITVLPFYHIYGLTVLLNISLHRGDTAITMPRFDLEQFLQLMQQHAVTRAYLVPPIVLALAKHPLVEKFNLSSLRSINSGAAPLGDNVEQACGDRLNCFVAQGYGLTETSPVVSTTPIDPAVRRPGSAGLLIPNTECKVVDPASGAELDASQQGEVCVRGPQVMKGYLNQPAATAAMLEPDGWLHTGDIGMVDEDGYLFIVDRLKELIKYKWFQVAPAELEGLLLKHPAVADAAAISQPDAEAGEVPKAFVVMKGSATPEELMAYVNGQVAPFKKIRQLEVVSEIPKSPAGKILRRTLIERERSHAGT